MLFIAFIDTSAPVSEGTLTKISRFPSCRRIRDYTGWVKEPEFFMLPRGVCSPVEYVPKHGLGESDCDLDEDCQLWLHACAPDEPAVMVLKRTK